MKPVSSRPVAQSLALLLAILGCIAGCSEAEASTLDPVVRDSADVFRFPIGLPAPAADTLLVRDRSRSHTLGADPEGVCAPFVTDEFTAAVASARDSIDTIMAGGEMPGVAVAAVVQGQLVWSEGFGVADVESSEPVCRPTMFRLGSVSKVLTGAALLRLADLGTLNLDTDVRTLVEVVRDKPHPISMRQLAGHLGGIRHYGAGEYFNTRRFSSVEEGLEVFVSDSLVAPPGTEYRYSSYGYNLLGAAMAAAAGKPYLDLVEESVLEPLALHHIHAESAVENSSALAKHYSGTRGSFTESDPFDSSDRWPSGGWVGSAEDVARMGSGLLDPDFLSPESQRLLRNSQRTLSGEKTGMSIGVRIESPDGKLVLHHGGRSVGARAFLLIRPETHVVIAMLANGGATFDQEHLLGIARLFER